jgi:putative PIN family toxin of toxin-antitoxin system
VGKGEKVVIDTNVFVSAFGWGGTPLKVIELLENGEIINCISEEILAELCSTLSYPKLDFPLELFKASSMFKDVLKLMEKKLQIA